MYDELAKKVNAIHAYDTIKLVIKIGYIINVKDIDEKKKILIKINILLLLSLINFLKQYLITD